MATSKQRGYQKGQAEVFEGRKAHVKWSDSYNLRKEIVKEINKVSWDQSS